jgi:hypothetical protein
MVKTSSPKFVKDPIPAGRNEREEFLLAPAAEQDLNDIWDYVADDSLDAADDLIEKLYDQILASLRPPVWDISGRIWRKTGHCSFGPLAIT